MPGRTAENCTWIVPSASNSSQAGAPFICTSRSLMTIWLFQTLRKRSVWNFVFKPGRGGDLPAIALSGDQLEILLVDGELVLLRAEDKFRHVLAGARVGFSAGAVGSAVRPVASSSSSPACAQTLAATRRQSRCSTDAIAL